MPQINAAELSKKIKAGELANVYYIYGKDIMTVENAVKAILKKALGKNWKNEYIKIEGKNPDVSNLLDTLEICPMFSEYNAVVLNDLNAKEISKDSLKQLTDMILNIPESTIFIINITGFDIYGGKKTITGENKKIIDAVSKNGIVCECGVKNAAETVKFICSFAEKQGCSISPKNAQMLSEYCLMDSMQITNEMNKLCAYKEGGEILAEDIDALVSGQIETDSFKLARAVVSMNSSLAFYLLDDLLNKRNEPIAVLATISMSFLDLYRARAAMTANKYVNDIAEDFKYKGREFAVKNAYRDCRRISLENLRKCICILRDTDKKLKTSSGTQRIVLEKAITQMLIAARE